MIYQLGVENILVITVNRTFLLYLLLFAVLFGMYAAYISLIDGTEKDLSKKHKYIRIIAFSIYAISGVLVLLLPLNIYSNDGIMYSSGPATKVVYFISSLCTFLCVIMMIAKYKNIKKKKTITLFAYIIGAGVTALIQQMNPALTLATSMETFLIFLMYNTIENPDVKMIEALQTARDQADKANRAKTEFLSSMSHEIRTPLNAIVGFSDYIMTSETLDEAKENAKDIVNASNTLLEIVNGILDISKIEAGKLEIVNSKYNARNTFESLAKLITPKMNEKGLDFSYYIAPDIPETLFGDHANIKKVITNLLSNAYKYTERGFVRYEVNCINSSEFTKLIITVEDSGRGIKQESIDKLFTKFQRLDEDRNTTIEGTGLGLAITKQLIELMGGKILVHTVYGEGSKFTVVLNQRIESTPVTEEKHEIKTTLDLKDKKILIVDDNALNIKVATKILERYNANHVKALDNGFSCIDDIKSGSTYDIILMDDMMPKMTGVETFKKLKEMPGFNMPVVILTANAITGMKEKYLSEGFDEYLAKPIEKDELIRVFNTIFDNYQTNQTDEIEQLEKTEELEIIDEEQVNTSSQLATNNPEAYLKDNNVDLTKALEFLGDMEMYNMTVTDFLTEVEEKWQRINSYKNTSDMPNYAIEVHSLKSDAKYLGLMFLADIAYQHELKSKENDETFINNYFKELTDAYEKALNIMKTYASMIK
ncbi:MAG: ATP-binding protein [Mycoplasmatota bacterium]|nr:ATP-binding protein [Mycoplasmatota bacterium]